jgi:hypothetical protein|tara:strand:+ start:2526 stop:2705 length:180 start_codon:yes stop_codon:yes gene_type:complete
MTAKEWLNKNEWPDVAVDSDAFSHYTKLSKIMEQYAREYHAKKLGQAKKQEETKFNEYL